MKKLIILFSILSLAFACENAKNYKVVDGAMLGTTFHIVADTQLPENEIYNLAEQIDSLAKASMSIFNDSSLLSQINSNQTNQADNHIIEVVKTAKKIWEISGGKYDVTVKPLTDAYGFAAKGEIDNPNIDSLLTFIGFDKIRVEGNTIIKADPRTQIDLNSIAKGYTVDWLAKALEEQGCQNYIVEVGGEICAKGLNPKGEQWRVGVDTPFEGNFAEGVYQQAVINITNSALATSGNYRRFHTDSNGNKVVHTIDPTTGKSFTSRLLSATVIASNCTTADALATMFMVVGEQKAEQLATDMRDSVQVYFVIAPQHEGEDYEEFYTLNDKQLAK